MTRAKRARSYITAIRVDAYREPLPSEGWTLKEFKERLIAHGAEWGEMGLGRAILENSEPPELAGGYVVAAGIWDSKPWVAIARPGEGYWFERIELIQAPWCEDWDRSGGSIPLG